METTKSVAPSASGQPHALFPRRSAYRCGSCGYGAMLAGRVDQSCPMCRATGWVIDERTRPLDMFEDLL